VIGALGLRLERAQVCGHRFRSIAGVESKINKGFEYLFEVCWRVIFYGDALTSTSTVWGEPDVAPSSSATTTSNPALEAFAPLWTNSIFPASRSAWVNFCIGVVGVWVEETKPFLMLDIVKVRSSAVSSGSNAERSVNVMGTDFPLATRR